MSAIKEQLQTRLTQIQAQMFQLQDEARQISTAISALVAQQQMSEAEAAKAAEEAKTAQPAPTE